MAENLTQVTETLKNINYSIDIDTSNIIQNAITHSNTSSDGWIGLIVLAIFSLAIFVHLSNNKEKYFVYDSTNLVLVFLCIMVDVIYILFSFSIIDSVQVLVFTFTAFFSVGVLSFIKKELTSGEDA